MKRAAVAALSFGQCRFYLLVPVDEPPIEEPVPVDELPPVEEPVPMPPGEVVLDPEPIDPAPVDEEPAPVLLDVPPAPLELVP